MQNTTPEVTFGDVAQYIPPSPDDVAIAHTAYDELRRLVDRGLVDVYLPAGWSVVPHRRFNVWLGHQIQPPHGERITLDQWVQRWYAGWQASQDQQQQIGGDAE